MPWLTAGITLVPSAIPTSIAPWPTSVTSSGSILFSNVTSTPGVAVVAGLVGEVERGELDASGCTRGPPSASRRRPGWGRARPAASRRVSGVAPGRECPGGPTRMRLRRRRRRRSPARRGASPARRRLPARRACGADGWSRWSRVSPVLAVRPRGDTARAARRTGAHPWPSLIRTLTVGPAGAAAHGDRGRVCTATLARRAARGLAPGGATTGRGLHPAPKAGRS